MSEQQNELPDFTPIIEAMVEFSETLQELTERMMEVIAPLAEAIVEYEMAINSDEPLLDLKGWMADLNEDREVNVQEAAESVTELSKSLDKAERQRRDTIPYRKTDRRAQHRALEHQRGRKE